MHVPLLAGTLGKNSALKHQAGWHFWRAPLNESVGYRCGRLGIPHTALLSGKQPGMVLPRALDIGILADPKKWFPKE